MSKLTLPLIFFLIVFNPSSINAYPSKKCVHIYYASRKKTDKIYLNSLQNTIYLTNLLGHFPHISIITSPIQRYYTGELNECYSNILLDTDYHIKIPLSFFHDSIRTKKHLMFITPNFNEVTKDYQIKLLNAFSKPVSSVKFYPQYFLYKNTRFKSQLDLFNKKNTKKPNDYFKEIYPFESTSSKTRILSWAVTPKNKWPYILKYKNRWLVTVNPFSYMAGNNHYMIFSDVLFDFLDEKPVHKDHLAFIRIEDISPITKPKTIYTYTNLFKSLRIPFGISVIPYYKDPLHVYNDKRFHNKSILDTPSLLNALKYAVKNGATIIWHGVTHQIGNKINPFNAVSGSDYEFWDAVSNRPISHESIEWYISRVEKGKKIFDRAGLYPEAWITPHYHASPFGNYVLSAFFPFQIGRVYYAPSRICIGDNKLPKHLQYTNGETFPSKSIEQFAKLKKLSIGTIEFPIHGQQLYPYIIYGDQYGINVIPESTGNVQPYSSNQVKHIITTDDILKTAKRNLVLRDAWVSFFVHEVILNTKDKNGIANYPGDISEIKNLLVDIKKLGYHFVDLKSFLKNHHFPRRARVTYKPNFINCK